MEENQSEQNIGQETIQKVMENETVKKVMENETLKKVSENETIKSVASCFSPAFIQPFISVIDNGKLFKKPISFLYAIIAILNILFPIYIAIEAISNNIFSAPFKLVFVAFLIWIVLVFISLISFYLWWDRKNKINIATSENDAFVATPVCSHIIQTIGEWIGLYIGFFGFLSSILATIFLSGREARMLPIPIEMGFVGILIAPIVGFLIIIFSRFIAEQFKALATIANNSNK